MQIKNIAIIAHVDHGKTTLTDALLRQCGAEKEGVSMDSNTLELERGITIYSKNASVTYPSNSSGQAKTKINIVDTPGHADFGSEVERVLRSVDCVLLVVDAQEGPMPQTRFVLKKSLELGLKPIVVINKVDKPAANPDQCEEQVLELFLELGASDEQSNFPVVYAVGRDGIAITDKSKLPELQKGGMKGDLTPLLDVILSHVPSASDAPTDVPLRLQPFNLAYDNFLGRMAIGRVYEGRADIGEPIFVKQPDGTVRSGKMTKAFTFEGLHRVEAKEITAGDIVLIAGLPEIDIGETITTDASVEPLPAITVDEPTITLDFLANNSPFAGREGKFVTSRQLRERLERELEVNVGLRVDFGTGNTYKVSGRGELHIAILLENMRREGYEMQVSQPQAIIREENGVMTEPFEEVVVDIPEEFQGTVIERLGMRGFFMKNVTPHKEGGILRMFFEGPTRGLLGYRNQFVVDTRGEGILSSRFLEFRPHHGEIRKRLVGSMISMTAGKALGFALANLQERGVLYIGAAADVYVGQVIGNTSKGEEMTVNPTKGKQLTNMRASGSDEAIVLVPPYELTIERGLEVMSEDEYLEITPKSVRLRKQSMKKI